MKSIRRISSFVSLLVCCVVAAKAEPAAVIAKAREFIGGNRALEAVKSVRYVGKLDTMEQTKDGLKPTTCGIEIIFQKPYQQRITLTTDKIIGVTGLDQYESWKSQESVADGSRLVDFPNKEQLKRFQASTWENLNFFSSPESRGGRIEDGGVVEKNGMQVHKVSFIHGPGIEYVRYFDPATGQLKFTETANSTIREEGFLEVEGVRFPKKIIQTDHLPNGKEQVVTITFDKVTVNETFPPELFRAPQPVMRRPAATASQPPR